MKIYAMEFTSNVAVAINGNKRQNFEAGDKVIVSRGEYLSLLRLGATLIAEKELTYSDIKFSKKDSAQKAEKKVEIVEEALETPEDTDTLETPEQAEHREEIQNLEGTPASEVEETLETK